MDFKNPRWKYDQRTAAVCKTTQEVTEAQNLQCCLPFIKYILGATGHSEQHNNVACLFPIGVASQKFEGGQNV